MARIKKYKMNPIDKKFSEKGGFTAQFVSDGNSVDGETEILPGVITDGGFKIAPEIAQRLIDKYFAACLNYGARTGENVKVGASGFVLMSIKGWYANKDSKAKKDNVRIHFRLANEIRPTAAFTLSNVNEGATLMLVSVTTEGCSLDHVKAGEKATINGKYTKMLEGDKVTARVGEGEARIEAECEVVDSGDQFIDIIVPEVFCDKALDGKEIIFTVEGRCGDPDAGTQTKDVSATLIVDAPSEPQLTSFVQFNQAGVVEAVGKMITIYDMIEVKGKNLPEGIKGRYALYDKDSGELKTATEWDPDPSITMFERVSSTAVRAQFKVNATPYPDGMWLDEGHPIKFEVKLPDESIISIDLPLV